MNISTSFFNKIVITLLMFLVSSMCINAQTITVTNWNDDGDGSLRNAIAQAQSGDIIGFDQTVDGQPIFLESNLSILKKVNITIQGRGTDKTIIDGSKISSGSCFDIDSLCRGCQVTITGMSIKNGHYGIKYEGEGAGSPPCTLTIDNCVISNNSFGISFDGYGLSSLNILNSSITDNENTGIYATSPTTISGCTIARNNSAAHDQSAGIVFPNMFTSAICSIQNSTIAENIGGIIIDTCSLSILNCTIANNTKSSSYGGNGIYAYRSKLTISNSICAYNNGDDASLESTEVVDNGYNIVGHSEYYTWNGNCDWTDPKRTGSFSCYSTGAARELILGSLANNGGPTQTMSITTDENNFSIPNYVGGENYNNSPAADQRGVARVGNFTDIGAIGTSENNCNFGDFPDYTNEGLRDGGAWFLIYNAWGRNRYSNAVEAMSAYIFGKNATILHGSGYEPEEADCFSTNYKTAVSVATNSNYNW